MTLLIFVLTLFNGIWCCTYQDALCELFENFGFIIIFGVCNMTSGIEFLNWGLLKFEGA